MSTPDASPFPCWKPLVHVLFGIVLVVLLNLPPRLQRQYPFYASALGMCLLWIVCQGCPINEYASDGREMGDVANLLMHALGVSRNIADILVYTFLIGSLTLTIFRVLRESRPIRAGSKPS